MIIDTRWRELCHLTNQTIITSRDSTSLAAKYTAMLNDVRSDRVLGSTCILGMYRAPGSKDRHHAFEGGLVAHLMEMWDAWTLLRNTVLATPIAHPINDSLVWRAILHHDLNKIWRYKLVMPTPEWEVDYCKGSEDALGHLLPSTYKTLSILNRFEIPLTPMLMNALITAEGGFSDGPRPKTETVLAKLVYILDELSANVFSRLNTGFFWDSKIGGLNGIEI